MGAARAALGGRRRSQYAVLRTPRPVQLVPAPRVVTPAAGEHRYFSGQEPGRWIFEREPSRFAGHASVVDRIVAGEAPGKLTDLHGWMGLQAPVETGKDLRRGLDPWRLDPIPSA